MNTVTAIEVDADLITGHTLLGCALREVAGPEQQAALADGHLILRLPRCGKVLRCEVARVSEVGAHTYRGPVQRLEGAWVAIGSAELAALIEDELTLRTGVSNEEFTAQVAASRETIARLLRLRPDEDPCPTGDPVIDSYVDSEQSLVRGHPRHPAPKWRSGALREWDSFAPELRTRFQLHWVAAPDIAEEGPFEELIRPLDPPAVPAGYAAIPMHPWQVRLHAPLAPSLLNLGPAGVFVRPTASVRTLYAPQADLFVKTSLHVRITNCLRKNARYELESAVALTNLLGRLEGVTWLPEPAFRTVDRPGLDEVCGVILRGGVRPHLRPGETPVLAAALAARPLALDDPLGWWLRYTTLLVPAVLGLWAEYGVVHEAHLQNVVVVRDAAGLPVRMLLRDMEGVKLDAQRCGAWLSTLPASVAYTPEAAFDRVAYCLFVNHLAELAGAIADAHPGVEARLWSLLRDVVAQASERFGHPPRLRALLAGVPLPAKGNLLVRWRREADRHAGYVPFPNPLGLRVGGTVGGQGLREALV